MVAELVQEMGPFARDRAAAIGWGALTVASRADEGARRAGLSLAQLRLLTAIALYSAHPSRLAEALDVKPPSVSRMADRLEALGLIERSTDGEDRRRVNHRLTERGREVLLEASRSVAAEMQMALSVLDRDERRVAEDGLVQTSVAAVRAWMSADGPIGWPVIRAEPDPGST